MHQQSQVNCHSKALHDLLEGLPGASPRVKPKAQLTCNLRAQHTALQSHFQTQTARSDGFTHNKCTEKGKSPLPPPPKKAFVLTACLPSPTSALYPKGIGMALQAT